MTKHDKEPSRVGDFCAVVRNMIEFVRGLSAAELAEIQAAAMALHTAVEVERIERKQRQQR